MPLVLKYFLTYLYILQTQKVGQTIWDKKLNFILVATYLQLLFSN